MTGYRQRRRWIFSLLLACSLLSGGVWGDPPVVMEGEREFYFAADLDGNGHREWIVADRLTGFLRVGVEDQGQRQWLPPRASGLNSLAGVAAGPFASTARDSLVLSGGGENRIHLFPEFPLHRQPQPLAMDLPESFPHSGTRPGSVAVLPIGSSGSGGLFDLVAVSDPRPEAFLHLLESKGDGDFDAIGTSAIAAPFRRLDPLRLHDAAPLRLTGMQPFGSDDIFVAYNLESSAAVVMDTVDGLPKGSGFVAAPFSGGPESHLVFYTPGSDLIREVPWDNGTFGNETTYMLNDPVAFLVAVRVGVVHHLLVVYEGGLEMEIFFFNADSDPASVDSFTFTPEQRIHGAVPLGDGSFALFRGPEGGVTSHADQFGWDGNQWVSQSTSQLPELPLAGSIAANLIFFDTDPFAVAEARVAGRLYAGDWATEALLDGGGVEADLHSWEDAETGLVFTERSALGAPPPGASHVLSNQIQPEISIFTRNPRAGIAPLRVEAEPAGGSFTTGVSVELTANDPTAQIFWRSLLEGTWHDFTVQRPIILQTQGIEFYAALPGGERRSPMRTAHYSILTPIDELDSNQDGVPDFVLNALGIDPVLSGPDADGDGVHNLVEILLGTDPNDPQDYPQNATIPVDFGVALDLYLSPHHLSHDPQEGSVRALPGARVRVYDVAGRPMASAFTQTLGEPGAPDPAAWLRDLRPEEFDRFLVATTDPVSPIQTAAADPNRGRELAGVVSLPHGVPYLPPVPFEFGQETDLHAEAMAWIAAAQNHFATHGRFRMARELDVLDTLALLLLEDLLGVMLESREIPPGEDLSLTAYRDVENPQLAATPAALQSLESWYADPIPQNYLAYTNLEDLGIRLLDAHDELLDALRHSADPAVVALRELALEIYRISAAESNSAPGLYRQPLDVLRRFLREGIIDGDPSTTGGNATGYHAALGWSSAELADVRDTAHSLVAEISPRPTAEWAMEVRMDTTDDPHCAIYDRVGSLDPVALLNDRGNPFRLPADFHFPVGAQLDVFGYTDVASDCAMDALEVIALRIQFLPGPELVDLVGNLLGDDWQRYFFPGESPHPFLDSDGDGATNLEEYFRGTDPHNPLSTPSPVLGLTAPVVTIEYLHAQDSFRLHFLFPNEIGQYLHFHYALSEELGETPFSHGHPPHATGDEWEVILPAPTEFDRIFFQLNMSLNP